MTREEYLEEIQEVLDRAALDRNLSLQDYADLCSAVWTDAQMKCEAAEADLRKKNK